MEGLIIWLYIVAGILWAIFSIFITDKIVNKIEDIFNNYYVELEDSTLAIIFTAIVVIIIALPVIFLV